MTAIKKTSGEMKEQARQGRKSSSPTPEPAAHLDLSTITINAKTGQILKIEGVDPSGLRHELSDDEKACLVKETREATLEAVIEQAFEAGIAYMLGDQPGEDEPLESEEDATLRHFLLRPLIEDSAAKRLMQRDVLSRAILGTLISQAAVSRAPHREGAPAQQRSRGGTSKSHQRTRSSERVQKLRKPTTQRRI